MNSVFFPSLLLCPPPLHHSAHYLHLQPQYIFCLNNRRSLFSPVISGHSSTSATSCANDGEIYVMNSEDCVEKDWSFLEIGDKNSVEELKHKIDTILSAGEIKEDSRVLVSIGSEVFVDQIVNSSPCHFLLVVHDSLLVLSCIKEMYDMVKCWQGELISVPDKWSPFDAVFLYFLPGLPFKLDHIFGALRKRCLPGSRIVISHPHGRDVLEQQRLQFPDVVTSDLPDKMTLQNVAADHSFQMTEFEDEPGFYLAVLKFSQTKSGK